MLQHDSRAHRWRPRASCRGASPAGRHTSRGSSATASVSGESNWAESGHTPAVQEWWGCPQDGCYYAVVTARYPTHTHMQLLGRFQQESASSSTLLRRCLRKLLNSNTPMDMKDGTYVLLASLTPNRYDLGISF